VQSSQPWTSAQANSSFSANSTAFELKRFCCNLFFQLEPMMSAVGARQASNILRSSAKLGLHPDAFVPGMADALAAKLLQVTKEEATRQPNAQEDANLLWALATLGHEPADKDLVEAICKHVARLIKQHDESKRPSLQNCANLLWALATLGYELADKGLIDVVCNHVARLIMHQDDSKRPNAQDCANVLWALATLGHEPADHRFLDAMCHHFARLIRHHDPSNRPNEQGAANFLWALATLGHEPTDKGLVDAVCKHFAMLIKHHDALKRPFAQGIANVMWALGELNHAPPAGAASAILERLIVLIGLPRQAPNAQVLSNILLACAVLRLPVNGHVGTALVDGLLSLDWSVVDKQAYCNAAWSLDVLDMLSVVIFSSLLERLQSSLVAEPANGVLKRQDLFQLYQALDSLQPLSTAAAQQLQEMVTRLGPRPLPTERSAAELSASKHLGAAIGQLGLAFTANVPLSGYWADAVLHPQDESVAPTVLVFYASGYNKKVCELNLSVSLWQCFRHHCSWLCRYRILSCIGSCCMSYARVENDQHVKFL